MQRSLCLACICVSGPSSECARCPDIYLYLFEFVSIFAFVFVPVFSSVFVPEFCICGVQGFNGFTDVIMWCAGGMCASLGNNQCQLKVTRGCNPF